MNIGISIVISKQEKPMIPKNKKETYDRKVVMLWTDKLYDDSKKLADRKNISVSELSRIAQQNIINENK